jgi:hypothetical protein
MELENEWTFYFHDPNNSNWEISSYIVVEKIKTVNEWIQVFHSFKNVWNKGMFFLMKETIQPIWEHEYNKNGGCMSFKLWKTEVNDCWLDLTGKLITHSLLKEGSSDKISGISISPKRNYCIVRIWLVDSALSDAGLYNIAVPSYSKMMYKSHSDNKDYAD